VSVYAYSTGELLRRFVSRNKAAVIASLLLVISIIVGAGITTNYAIEAHQAKLKALHALEEVTALSESTMMLVRSKAQAINAYFEKLEKDMTAAAAEISSKGFGDSASIERTLTAISGAHPEASAFLLIDLKGNIVDASPPAATLPKDVIAWELRYLKGERRPEDGDVSALFESSKGHKAFALSLPIVKGGKLLGGLTALMQVEKAIPVFLDFDPRKSDFQVWLMKDDGLIVYDEDEKQIGLNLFTAEMYQGFPELKKFGEQIRKQPWGIGHYAFGDKDNRGKTYKVAAWDTLASDGTEWKLVVTRAYAGK
jgi:serine/threonine-protein kinase